MEKKARIKKDKINTKMEIKSAQHSTTKKHENRNGKEDENVNKLKIKYKY